MKRNHALLLIAAAAAGGCHRAAPPATPAPQAREPNPAAAVSYVEKRVGGLQATRSISPSGDRFEGVDINSRLDIVIDRDRLRSAVDTTARSAALTARIITLNETAERISDIAEHALAASRAYGRNETAFLASRGQMASAARGVLDTLRSAVVQRLAEETSLTPQAIQDSSFAVMNRTVTTSANTFGVDTKAVAELFAEEIAHLQARLDAEPPTGLALAVLAYQSGGSRQNQPVPLRGYNTINPAAPTVVPKITFAVPADEAALWQAMDSLSKTTAAAKSVGNAVISALELELDRGFPELLDALGSAQTAVRGARDATARLAQDPTALKPWANSVIAAMRASDPTLTTADTVLTSMVTDLQNLARLADIRSTIQSQNPPQAMATLLGIVPELRKGELLVRRAFDPATWQRRTVTLASLNTAIQGLDPGVKAALTADSGPWPAIQQLRSAATQVEAAVRSASAAGVAILQTFVEGEPGTAAANVPIPEGQQRLSLARDLNTVLDLQTLPGGRSDGDRLEVRYEVYRGDSVIDAWRDEFEVRSYGFTGKVSAAMSFTQQENVSTWQPLPSLNWLLRYRNWPGNNEPGLRPEWWTYLVPGVGFSTMSLDFDEDENVELGLGLTVSFLDDRLMAGHGWNLQTTDNRSYWYFAIRLFNAPGTLGRF